MRCTWEEEVGEGEAQEAMCSWRSKIIREFFHPKKQKKEKPPILRSELIILILCLLPECLWIHWDFFMESKKTWSWTFKLAYSDDTACSAPSSHRKWGQVSIFFAPSFTVMENRIQHRASEISLTGHIVRTEFEQEVSSIAEVNGGRRGRVKRTAVALLSPGSTANSLSPCLSLSLPLSISACMNQIALLAEGELCRDSRGGGAEEVIVYIYMCVCVCAAN